MTTTPRTSVSITSVCVMDPAYGRVATCSPAYVGSLKRHRSWSALAQEAFHRKSKRMFVHEHRLEKAPVRTRVRLAVQGITYMICMSYVRTCTRRRLHCQARTCVRTYIRMCMCEQRDTASADMQRRFVTKSKDGHMRCALMKKQLAIVRGVLHISQWRSQSSSVPTYHRHHLAIERHPEFQHPPNP